MCLLSTTFRNAPTHPPILFDQSLTQRIKEKPKKASALAGYTCIDLIIFI